MTSTINAKMLLFKEQNNSPIGLIFRHTFMTDIFKIAQKFVKLSDDPIFDDEEEEDRRFWQDLKKSRQPIIPPSAPEDIGDYDVVIPGEPKEHSRKMYLEMNIRDLCSAIVHSLKDREEFELEGIKNSLKEILENYE